MTLAESRQVYVDLHGIPFISARGKHYGGPKVRHLRQMLCPMIAHGASEDRAQQLILSDARIEAINKIFDLFFTG